jgi:CheY-like chemotaxis protein
LNAKKTILLVDDDVEDQEIFAEVIRELNQPINCNFVTTAEEALRTLAINAEDSPDYIFLDLNLPFMTGFECLELLKQSQQLQGIPVVVYSTSSRDTDQQKAKDLGAKDYIIKPSTFGELKTKLQGVLN